MYLYDFCEGLSFFSVGRMDGCGRYGSEWMKEDRWDDGGGFSLCYVRCVLFLCDTRKKREKERED